MDYILGIDAGTSNVKAVLFDEGGREVRVASREAETVNNGGNWEEQDMLLVWEKVKDCVKELTASGAADVSRIRGIGVTGQGEGCWLIDEEGRPVQNAILWCDGRAVSEVRKITRDHPEVGQLYHTTTGTPPLLGNQMVLLRWMKTNRKEVLDRASKLLFCKDWIRYKMTGLIGTEITDSFTSLMDAQTGKIADELMKAMDIYEYRSYLPDPVSSDTVVGTITKEFAQETGLPEGIPVIAGALDTSATAVGLGAIHEKDACVILGTTCASEIVMRKEDCRFGAENSRYEKHPIEELYVELQPTLNGTPNIDWMLENIAKTKDFDEIDRIVDSVPVGCGGVVYHPYISVAGERAPFYHPYARASFFGISQVTTRNQLIRAVYEGISLSIRDCLQNIDKDANIHLAGGGAKSPVWRQIVADVLRMPVESIATEEGPGLGAAMLAAVGCGAYASVEEIADAMVRVTGVVEPNLQAADRYDEAYARFRRLYPAIREVLG